MQYSNVFHKEPGEALKEASEKYTSEQFTAALCAIKKQLREDYDDTKKLFLLAIASKKM
jgi:hypothetical protein